MMIGLQTYGLAGLRSLGSLGDGIPPVTLCKDAAGNTVDCGAGSGAGSGPCDPTFVAMGYSCYVDGSGNPTYVPAGGNPPTPGGTGTQGTSTGAGAGKTPTPGAPKKESSWQIWLLAGVVLVLGAEAVSK